MTTEDRPQPLFWVGSCRKNLRAFPAEVRRVMGFALWQAQMGDKHVAAKVLKGFGGAGVLEVVGDHKGSTYRAVYTVKFSGATYALHAFQKKSKKGAKTPPKELDVVRKRLKVAEEHYAKWRSEQERKGSEESSDEG